MMEILRNKVIIVVGASSGIGAAMSDYFSEKGAIAVMLQSMKRLRQWQRMWFSGLDRLMSG